MGDFSVYFPFFGQSEALLASSVFQDEHLVMHSIEYVYCIMYNVYFIGTSYTANV